MTLPPPPQEFLERAFRRLRTKDWEATLEEALTHPIHSKLVLGMARSLMTPSHPEPEKNLPNLPEKPMLPARPIPLDRKRLASGEREDD